MEMEGSRRSIDRSREPGLKKPRLDDGIERGLNGVIDRERLFPQRVASGAISATGPQISRFRTNERERNVEKHESVREIHQQQQHQEIVSRYKTALAELTFNSKPFITNLTIIAGENLHAAKWIAAIICENILEVPSEQKLPSLYLLDSIVKNIGRDYIKCFAAKLPEVFCKAYRQVDSSIHSGMRHLFGTWKGVFPPASLQMIEKELGFSAAVNGSSSGATTSRPDSQSQRPPNSIHVNPKYLEARQRLQQSNKDPRLSQREASSEPVHEKKSSAGYEYLESGSDLSRHSDLVIGRDYERANEQDGLDKPSYGSGSNAAETNIGLRNVFDMQDGFSKYRAPKSAQVLSQLQPTDIGNRGSRGMNKSWKNSEEEEYIWDDMSSRLADHGGPDSSSADGWSTDDAEKPEIEDHLPQAHGEHDIGSRIYTETSSDSLSIAQRAQAPFGHRTTSIWPSQEPRSVDGLKHISITSRISGYSEGHPTSFSGSSTSLNSSSLGRTGFETLTGPSVSIPNFGSMADRVSGSGGFSGQQRHHSFTEKDHLRIQSSQPGQKTSHLPGKLSQAPYSQLPQDSSLPIRPQNHIKSQPPQHIQASFPQLRHPGPFSQQLHSEPTQSLPSSQTPKPLPQPSISGSSPIMGHSAPGLEDAPGQPSTGNLLAAIMKSGLLSSNSVTGGLPNPSFKDSGVLPSHLSIQHPPPSGPPTQLAISSTPMATPVPLGSTSSLSTHPQRTATLPPLPPGPPPASSLMSATASQTSNVASVVPNPLSSLLSTLVAKGLISSPSKEMPTLTSPQVASQLPKQSPVPKSVSSNPSSPSSTISTSSGNDLLFKGSAAKITSTVSKSMKVERENLIGIEFKPEIIRESHPSVISDLFDDLPHKCSICGHRLKFQEQLDLHLEWHASKTLSRRWYPSLGVWVTGSEGSLSGSLVKTAEKSEPVVPADESQCVCILCGEPFEDFYSHNRDEWMYKGATYMSLPAVDGDIGTTDGCASLGPIVHTNCASPTSVSDLGLSRNVKPEQMDG